MYDGKSGMIGVFRLEGQMLPGNRHWVNEDGSLPNILGVNTKLIQEGQYDMENKIDYIIGFRYNVTGVFGYEFYRNKEMLCTVSSIVVPDPPVMISGYKQTLVCESVGKTTVFPGTTRCVYDSESKKIVANVIYKDFVNYVINNFCNVNCDVGSYEFIRQGEVIAGIKRFEGKPSWYPDSSYRDYEAYFEVSLSKELDNEQRLLVMAFPMIRFGL